MSFGFKTTSFSAFIILISAIITLAMPRLGSAKTFDSKAALATSQAALGNTLSNYEFVDTNGQRVRLSDYRGKPLIISLIYTSCYYICPTTTQHLAEVVRKANDALDANRFHILSIGFDTQNDTPEAMRAFATQQSVDIDSWKFVSADQATINRLVEELGFQYIPSPHGFDHLIQASIIDPDGQLYRQVYGMNFETPHLIGPLKELVFGEPLSSSLLSQITTKIRFFCTVYDPASDRYRYDYSVVMGFVIGLLCIGTFGTVLTREWLRTLRAD